MDFDISHNSSTDTQSLFNCFYDTPLQLLNSFLNLNLKVDGLVSSALSAHVGPMFVQPALECIDRWRHHNVLR